jgi:DNA-directed RNA polymerase specialized sigma24 family protein
VVQDTFLKLLERPPVLPEETRGDGDAERAHLSSWLHKVTRNGCMDSAQIPIAAPPTRDGGRRPEVAHRSQAGGAELAEERDTRAAVERGLARLPQDQREVLSCACSRALLQGDRRDHGKKIGTVGG